jgi:hypothetical protein
LHFVVLPVLALALLGCNGKAVPNEANGDSSGKLLRGSSDERPPVRPGEQKSGKDQGVKMNGGKTTASESSERAFKGMELYSWQEQDSWRYSLLEGTNRSKSIDEITAASVTIPGNHELETRLSQLAPGETVVWTRPQAGDNADFAYPDLETLQQLVEFCQSRGVALVIPEKGILGTPADANGE